MGQEIFHIKALLVVILATLIFFNKSNFEQVKGGKLFFSSSLVINSKKSKVILQNYKNSLQKNLTMFFFSFSVVIQETLKSFQKVFSLFNRLIILGL